MRSLRLPLTAALALLLGACGPEEECFRPLTGQEAACDVVTETQWNLHADSPIQDLDALCAASCIDVPGRVSISGFSDLRRVPLLARVRTIRDLAIDVEGLTDLRGIEHVDIRNLELSTHGGDLTSFRSLEGLSDRDLEGIDLKQVFGLKEFAGSRFDHLGIFSADQTGLEQVDLSNLSMVGVQLRANQVRRLSLGRGTLDQISIIGNSSLSELSWASELRVKSHYIVNNLQLSSCLVQDFITASSVGTIGGITNNNGPCP